MNTRTLLLLLPLSWSVMPFGVAATFDEIRRKAETLAQKPYDDSAYPSVPKNLLDLTWSEHDQIRFKPDMALWRKEELPFHVEFFHPGYVHKQAVSIHQVTPEGSLPVPVGPKFYDYGTNRLTLPENLGHAGFRIVRPVAEFGEVATFLGASYFRMIGQGQNYGASARGLALDTGTEKAEEFPVLREFWIEQPSRDAQAVTVHALLDSPSATGAYRFIIHPGRETVAEIKAALFPRKTVDRFGVAPLTSMFLHGENGRPRFQDFRPEVHDSDGLLMHTSKDEWVWHPLEAGQMMRLNTFTDDNPKGFGLLQRDRDYEHYQDRVARFENRPSVWVNPKGRWGPGKILLMQLPTDREFHDNVVVQWIPDAPPKPGEVLELEYELHWTLDEPGPPTLGRVVATRIGRVFVDPPQGPPNLRFVVDFKGPGLKSAAPEDVSVLTRYDARHVRLVAETIYPVTPEGIQRLVVEIVDPGKAVDLSAVLRNRAVPMTETWTFTWQP